MRTVPAWADGSRLPEDTATLRSDPSAGRLFRSVGWRTPKDASRVRCLFACEYHLLRPMNPDSAVRAGQEVRPRPVTGTAVGERRTGWIGFGGRHASTIHHVLLTSP
jgi:hypothetical protein